ncbi:peptidyl-prolyl cis-trans isomerase [Microbulbifer pacificus]|uniref:peptidylprolyl isomerase n=1 Tax=Microbulbifer pacificus TaxID=407164 RepID=UPI000CF5517D|nr:peptidylprolyl isomerase [Microbulbifer pacificus]
MKTQNASNRRVATLPLWIRDPLFHFIVVGMAIFAISALRQAPSTESDIDVRQIVITPDDLMQMQLALRMESLPPRHSAAFDSLIETRVREEVLYREALAMGLDKNDIIVKRRMAQKMDFLAEDISALREPTQKELEDWYEAHTDTFAIPPRITFSHRFFAFDRHGDNARNAARSALAEIASATPADQLGDPFMFQDYYPDRTPMQISSVFGPDFSRQLSTLPPREWSGPVESGFGWHLVYIDSIVPSRIPEFEEVSAEIKADWFAHQRESFKRTAYELMRAKYEVVLPVEENITASTQENAPGDKP